ncbi:hypothetical protein NITLEN_30322 [Nitrospira lenta]|uniref:Uncharacterized protein n=1 Tax=Nitrospira lenta TaxID=1436998 RepID=A0A330L6Q6_9BACT|nr:hypothetical protein NITLEN_30322 [Nitrospira lenta]
MGLLKDEQHTMLSNIAESMWVKSGRVSIVVALSLWSIGGGNIPIYAHEGEVHPVSDSSSGPRHSLLKPVRPVDMALPEVKEAATISSISEPGQKSSKKKKAKVITKKPAAESQRVSAIEPPGRAPVKIEESASGMKATSLIASGVPAMAGAGMSTTMSGTTAMAAAAPSASPAIAAAAPGASGSSVVGGPSTPSNRGLQRLSSGIPGLTRAISTPLPPETIAMPAPPLGSSCLGASDSAGKLVRLSRIEPTHLWRHS